MGLRVLNKVLHLRKIVTGSESAPMTFIYKCNFSLQQVPHQQAERNINEIHGYLDQKSIDGVFYGKVYVITNTGPCEEMPTLKIFLEDLVKGHLYWIPNSWLQLKEEMQKEAHLTRSAVKKIGRDIGLHAEHVLRAAVTFFHNIGSLVAFDNVPLSQVIFTNPLWLIDQFKQVIAIKRIEAAFKRHERYKIVLIDHGVLHEALVEAIWPDSYREDLLAILDHFGFIQLASEDHAFGLFGTLPEPGRKFLVPSQLPPPEEKDFICDLSIPKVRFQSSHNTIQTGTFSRLITSLCNDQEEPCWESLRIHSYDAILISNKDPEDQIFLNQTSSYISIGADQDEPNSATLRSALLVIADKLLQVAGPRTFDVHLNCTDCEQTEGWTPFCPVADVTKEKLDSLLKKRVCREVRHRRKLANTGYTRWFSPQQSQVKLYSLLYDKLGTGH